MLHNGDCLDVLRTLDDNSIDSIVTDPPYGLAFMGKRWDYDVPSVEVWAECLRVLKPGGHLLAFAGTRTQHRMCVRIEDAGFEIRDMIAWVYGSGFPKSHDVSKAIDRHDAAEKQEMRRKRFTQWVRSTGVTARQIDEATGTNMGGHYTTAASQPAIMTREHLEACRHLFGDVPQWVEREADIRSVESENFKMREVVGQDTKARSTSGASALPTMGGETVYQSWDITAPATDAARQWQGWGTALKPALEPITVARKPLSGTVADNVMRYGTGAINVDGCRVATDEPRPHKVSTASLPPKNALGGSLHGSRSAGQTSLGRWPANLIHDGSDEVLGLFPDAGGGFGRRGASRQMDGWGMNGNLEGVGYGDSGSAARFFYCAKASKRDRDEGLTLPPRQYSHDGRSKPIENAYQRNESTARNNHPTVKPTDLMRYLCRLVTSPGGVVLDPFMGSGSTGKAAALEGFRFVGIERDPAYMEIARQRIEAVTPEPSEDKPAPSAPPAKTKDQLSLFP